MFHNFVQNLLDQVDLILNDFVFNSYQNFVLSYSYEFGLLLSLAIVILGLQGIYQGYSLASLIKPFSRMLFVFACATQWPIFNTLFYNVFTNEPAHLMQVMVSPNGVLFPGGANVADALNQVFLASFKAANDVMQLGGFSAMQPYIWGVALHLVNFLSMAFAIFLILYAKMAMSLLLFLGPLFLSFLLFDSTKSFFEKWLQQLVSYALIPVLTSGALMLTLSVSNALLGNLTQILAHPNAAHPMLTSAMGPFIIFQIISLFFMSQIIPKAAALGGGVALAGFDRLSGNLRSTQQRTQAALRTLSAQSKKGAQVLQSALQRAPDTSFSAASRQAKMVQR